MSWGATMHAHEEYGPSEVAYDLGWSDGYQGREIRPKDIFTETEGRAYLDGYRLGERGHSGELGSDDAEVTAAADRLIKQVHDTRPGWYVAGVVAVLVVVMVLVAVFG